MTSEASWNLLIFRPGPRSVSTLEVLASFRERLKQVEAPGASQEAIIDALLSAGELESALADAAFPAEKSLRDLTDSLALRLLARDPRAATGMPTLPPLSLPPTLQISPQEGFAYYALHPLDYAELIRELPVIPSAAVVGIRSIGVTLSAVLVAALKARGVEADRITVRPAGPAYDRRTKLNTEQLAWVTTQCRRGAQFLIADEGPGISGSSFLSVGDALVEAGVPRESIVFLCTRRPDPSQLKAPNAARRWPRFRACYLPGSKRLPAGAEISLQAGRWRSAFLPRDYHWPTSWTTLERSKFLSTDRRWFFKFEGFGKYGESARQRGRILSQAGFSICPEAAGHGFTRYQVVTGTPLAASHLTRPLLEHLARYCAFRAATMTTSSPASDLAAMARHNLQEEFGVDDLPPGYEEQLATPNPVITDSRMMPHDWIAASDGRWLKVDATCHGDDHLFPGPTDVAWDLAGAIVEWQMDGAAAGALIDRYRSLSGDLAVISRLPAYLLAYSAFRTAYCRMAAAAMYADQEASRLQHAYWSYRQVVARQLDTIPHPRARPVSWQLGA
jgi:hypothetical protein